MTTNQHPTTLHAADRTNAASTENAKATCCDCGATLLRCDECGRATCTSCYGHDARDCHGVVCYVVCGGCCQEAGCAAHGLGWRLARAERRAAGFARARVAFNAFVSDALASGSPQRIREAHAQSVGMLAGVLE